VSLCVFRAPLHPQYHDAQADSYYHHDTYAPGFSWRKKEEPTCFLHRLFPWFNKMSQRRKEVGALEEHTYHGMAKAPNLATTTNLPTAAKAVKQ
jgi:hypothetical protein